MSRPRTLAVLTLVVVAVAGGLVLLLTGDDDVDLVAVRDTTGTLTVEAPSGWTDIDTEPAEVGGRATPYIKAAPDLAAYEARTDAPGLEALRVDDLGRDAVRVVLEETVERLRPTDTCTDRREERVSRNGYEGLAAVYTGCGERESDLWLYVLVAPADDELLVLGIQAASDEEREAVLEALAS